VFDFVCPFFLALELPMVVLGGGWAQWRLVGGYRSSFICLGVFGGARSKKGDAGSKRR